MYQAVSLKAAGHRRILQTLQVMPRKEYIPHDSAAAELVISTYKTCISQ